MKHLIKSLFILGLFVLGGVLPPKAQAEWTAGAVTLDMIQNAGIANGDLANWLAGLGDGSSIVLGTLVGDDITFDAADDIFVQFGARSWSFDAGLNSLEPNTNASLGATQPFSVIATDELTSGADDLAIDVVDDISVQFGARTWTFDAGLNSLEPQSNGSIGATQALGLLRSGEVEITGAATSGGALCTKADGNIGQCTDAVGGAGTCTCA